MGPMGTKLLMELPPLALDPSLSQKWQRSHRQGLVKGRAVCC